MSSSIEVHNHMFHMIRNGEETDTIMAHIEQNIPDFNEEIVDPFKDRHALSAAIAHQRPSLIRALLEKDVEWEVPDKDGKYPLHLATERHGILFLSYLLVSLYTYDHHLLLINTLALLPSCSNTLRIPVILFFNLFSFLFKDTDTIQKLKDLDHDMNIQNDEDGDTPLHSAKYDQVTFDFLLALGADRSLENWNDRKPKRPSMWAAKDTADPYGDF